MVQVRARSSLSRHKLVLRSLAIGGALFAIGRCTLFFIQANSLLDIQVKDINPFSLVDEKQKEDGNRQGDFILPEEPALVAVERLKAKQPAKANDETTKNDGPSSSNKIRERNDDKDSGSKAAKLDETDKDTATKANVKHEKPDSNAKKNSHGSTDTVERKKPSRKKHFHVVDEPKKAKPPRTASAKRRLPFYLHGVYKFLDGPHDPRKKLIQNLRTEKYKAIGSNVTTWALPITLKHPTRNHDSVILEGTGGSASRPIMVTLLGRYSRYIQSMDLLSGKQTSMRTKGKDPSGNPIDDLNHVTAVVVDSLKPNGGQEIWLPCGFHNDAVNHEMSTDYVRIVDTKTMKVRVGPKLPVAGGACISKALPIIKGEPPMICSFAGTQGNHDKGTFLPFTQCYDRMRKKWWSPFGKLPYGLDHGSLAVIPAGTCHASDPARVLIFNFRTRAYGTPHSEFLGYDLPKDGWTVDELKSYEKKPTENWFVYHNVTDTSLLKNVPRDASGVVTANNGRAILNFGGTYRTPRTHTRGNNKRTQKGRTSMIRSFDVCKKEWNVVGDLGLKTFALQTAASDSLGVAVTCGGEAPLMNSNSPFCFVSRWNNVTVSNPQSNALALGADDKNAAKK